MSNPYRTLTTKTRILYYLNGKGWVSGTELESQAWDWGTKASVITRRARELVNERKLDRILGDKRTVQYRIHRTLLSTPQASSYLEKLRLEEERENQVSLI